MKATLTFNLSDPSDRDHHTQALKAPDVFIAIDNLNEFLRRLRKYSDLTGLSAEDLLEQIESYWYAELNDNDLKV